MEEIVTVDVVPDGHKISVVFERKISDGDYGGTTVRTYVEGAVPTDANEAQVAEKLAALFMPAVAAAFDQLGVDYTIEDGQILRETLRVPAPKPQPRPSGTPGTQQHGAGNGSLRVMNPGYDPADHDPIPPWLTVACARDGVTAVFDNRLTVTGNQPLFKEAARPPQGHGKNGDAKGYWLPK